MLTIDSELFPQHEMQVLNAELQSKTKNSEEKEALVKQARSASLDRTANNLIAQIEALRSELQSIKERDAKLGQRLTSGHRAIAQVLFR